jgi:hypothetical protein
LNEAVDPSQVRAGPSDGSGDKRKPSSSENNRGHFVLLTHKENHEQSELSA